MTRIAIPIATLALTAIGAAEATFSAQQLAESAGRPRLDSAGMTLSAAGLLASALVYLVLGHLAVDDRAAVRAGAMTGALAGVIGGTIRALIISGEVSSLVLRYATVPDWFVPAALIVFIGLSCAASVAGGAALAWTGRRVSRAVRSRPRA